MTGAVDTSSRPRTQRQGPTPANLLWSWIGLIALAVAVGQRVLAENYAGALGIFVLLTCCIVFPESARSYRAHTGQSSSSVELAPQHDAQTVASERLAVRACIAGIMSLVVPPAAIVSFILAQRVPDHLGQSSSYLTVARTMSCVSAFLWTIVWTVLWLR